MKLMTKELEAHFKKIGSQEAVDDPTVLVKFFDPSGSATWYATELFYVIKRKDEDGETETLEVAASKIDQFKDYEVVDMVFFGYASIFGDHNDEWGYFSLSEIQSVKGPFGLGIERDLYFEPQPISKACPKALGRIK